MSSLKFIYIMQGNSLIRVPKESLNAEKSGEERAEAGNQNPETTETSPEPELSIEEPKSRNKRNKTSRG